MKDLSITRHVYAKRIDVYISGECLASVALDILFELNPALFACTYSINPLRPQNM